MGWWRATPAKPKPDHLGAFTSWWIGEIKGGRVRLTFDLYWCLRDLATREGFSADEWDALGLKGPDKPLSKPS